MNRQQHPDGAKAQARQAYEATAADTQPKLPASAAAPSTPGLGQTAGNHPGNLATCTLRRSPRCGSRPAKPG
jgi:hypothetical protein